MPVLIPPPKPGSYSLVTPYRLDGVSGQLFWRWNLVHGSWMLWLLAADGSNLAGPVSMVPGDDLFAQWRHFEIPPGELRVESSVERPGALDFGTLARLVYYTAAEVAADATS